jgi:hypothetical protein
MPGTRDAKYSVDPQKYRKNWDGINWGTSEEKPKPKKKKKKEQVNIVIKVK